MGTPVLLLFLKAITEDSNLANFPGIVPAVNAFLLDTQGDFVKPFPVRRQSKAGWKVRIFLCLFLY